MRLLLRRITGCKSQIGDCLPMRQGFFVSLYCVYSLKFTPPPTCSIRVTCIFLAPYCHSQMTQYTCLSYPAQDRLRLALLFTSLIGLWLIGNTAGWAQTVPDGAARIDIKTDLTDSLLFERVVTLLQADGYSGNFRTEKARVVTDSRPIDSGNWTARIIAALENGTVAYRRQR